MQTIQNLLQKEAEAILNIPVSDSYFRAVDLIYQAVHVRHGKVVTSGMGKAGQVAVSIATTFCSTGTPAVNLHPAEAQHGDLGVIQPDDILLLVSNSGRTREVLELLALAHRLYENLPLIVITSNAESELAKQADVALYTGRPAELCPLGLTPTASTTVMGVMGDILVVELMKKIGFTNEEYAKRHHGGYLGEKSRNQTSR
jgi:arabinose-5-phosphate isomerase